MKLVNITHANLLDGINEMIRALRLTEIVNPLYFLLSGQTL